jgi:catechol 2,3-dioxygenase-like lactoylglutathione lyase family enzyme
MYDHIGLRVSNLDTSLKFYEAALAPLGHVAGSKGDDYAGLGPKDAPALWLHLVAPGKAGAAHVAFRATSRAAVDKFHAAGLKAGGRDNGAPGPRPDYGPSYYAAFLTDPDGHNVEAVCLA